MLRCDIWQYRLGRGDTSHLAHTTKLERYLQTTLTLPKGYSSSGPTTLDNGDLPHVDRRIISSVPFDVAACLRRVLSSKAVNLNPHDATHFLATTEDHHRSDKSHHD